MKEPILLNINPTELEKRNAIIRDLKECGYDGLAW